MGPSYFVAKIIMLLALLLGLCLQSLELSLFELGFMLTAIDGIMQLMAW